MGVYVSMYFATVILLAGAPDWARRMPSILVRLGIAQAVLGLGVFLLFSAGIEVGGVAMGQVVWGAPSVHTTFVEGNLLGAFLALVCVLIAVELVILREPGRSPRMLLAGFCLCGVTLVLTLTRSAWIALLLMLMALVTERLLVTRSAAMTLRAFAPVVAGVAVIIAVSAVVLDPLLSRSGGEDSVLLARVTSLSVIAGMDPESAFAHGRRSRVALGSHSAIMGRLSLLRTALGRWPEAPLLGHGTFAGEIIARRYWMSSLVQALYDTGLVGVAGLIALQMLMVVIPWREARRLTDPPLRACLLGCAGGNAVLGLTSLLSSFLWVGFPWIFMGLTMALATTTRRDPERVGSRAEGAAATA
jgi:O-antigen ligase